MVKWLNKKDRAKLQFEYHKGTIEARKSIIQELFDWTVTYENFCEDWLERIEQVVSEHGKEAGEEWRRNRAKEMRRATPPEKYFWDVICRSIHSDQSYEGALGHDDSENNIAMDPDSPIAHYRYPLWWMLDHCNLMTGNPPLSPGDEERAKSYGRPKAIRHNAKTRLFQCRRTLHRFWREIAGFFGLVYLFEIFREIVLELIR